MEGLESYTPPSDVSENSEITQERLTNAGIRAMQGIGHPETSNIERVSSEAPDAVVNVPPVNNEPPLSTLIGESIQSIQGIVPYPEDTKERPLNEDLTEAFTAMAALKRSEGDSATKWENMARSVGNEPLILTRVPRFDSNDGHRLTTEEALVILSNSVRIPMYDSNDGHPLEPEEQLYLIKSKYGIE